MKRLGLMLLAAAALVAAAPQGTAERVAARVRADLPTATVTIPDPSTLKVKLPGKDAITVSLDRLRDFCSVNDAESCRNEEMTFAKGVREMASIDYAVTRPQLRIVVRDADYAAGVVAIGKQKLGQEVYSVPLAPGIAIILAADFPNTVRMVTARDLKDLGLDRDAAVSLATDQVLKTLPPIPTIDELKKNWVVINGYDYGAAMLLRPERWRALAEATGGKLFVAVPADNEVVIGVIEPGAPLAKVRELVSEAYSTASRGISPIVYRWSPNGWVAAQ